MIQRRGDVSRLEGFSDAVFGFAITLLVVSLAVPRSFDELLSSLTGVPAFAASFALLAYIWYAQYSYFRRYDFEDRWVVVLNLVLLFVVLVYVYPLKFLYATLFNFNSSQVQLTAGQTPILMVIYGAGFAAVFLVLSLLHLHAYRSRRSLGLTPIRSFEARVATISYAATAAVGLLSAGIALLLPVGSAGLAGFAYFLVGVPPAYAGARVGRRRRAKGEG